MLIGLGDGCLQSLAVLQKAPAIPKVDLSVQTLLQGDNAAVQGVLLAPAAMSARGSSQPGVKGPHTPFVLRAHVSAVRPQTLASASWADDA